MDTNYRKMFISDVVETAKNALHTLAHRLKKYIQKAGA